MAQGHVSVIDFSYEMITAPSENEEIKINYIHSDFRLPRPRTRRPMMSRNEKSIFTLPLTLIKYHDSKPPVK